MVWVRSEYAGELAVVSVWLSVLVPWNVSVATLSGGSLVFVRFPFGQIRYNFGVPLARGIALSDPLSAFAFQQGQTIGTAYAAWVVGAGVLAVAVAYSLVYYAREARVESWPLDPVRAIGALLAVTAVVFGVATFLLVTRGFPGFSLPVGVLLQFAFAGVLLTVERT